MSHLRTVITGFCMGIADLIPGVSGGTIAFISGLYERLITAISHFDKKAVHQLFTGKRKKLRHHIDGTFLVALFGGIVCAIALGSGVITWALTNYPVLVDSFFVGLVLMSIIMLIRQHPLTTRNLVFLFIVGLVVGNILTQATGISLPLGYTGLFVAGFLGSTAMVLPGISGSYILLIIGAYEVVLGHIHGLVQGLKALDSSIVLTHLIPVLAIGAGVIVGIIVMSRLIKWALKKRHNEIILFLLGLMTGAIPAITPDITLLHEQWTLATVCFLVGILAIWLFFEMGQKK